MNILQLKEEVDDFIEYLKERDYESLDEVEVLIGLTESAYEFPKTVRVNKISDPYEFGSNTFIIEPYCGLKVRRKEYFVSEVELIK